MNLEKGLDEDEGDGDRGLRKMDRPVIAPDTVTANTAGEQTYNTLHNKDIASLQSSNNSDKKVQTNRMIIDIHTDNKHQNYQRNRSNKYSNNKSKHNFSFGNNNINNRANNNENDNDGPEDLSDSKDTDFERYKRKKKQEHDYQFKK